MPSLNPITNYIVIIFCILPCGKAAVIAKSCPEISVVKGFLHRIEQQQGRPTMMNYRCDEGYKPITGGWWSTITCEEGKWSPDPECIGENDCIHPAISNAEVTHKKPYYKDKDSVAVQCNKGYATDNQYAHCNKGEWTLPDCKRDENSCSAPPKVINAIIREDYEDIFNEYDVVYYKCMNKYEMRHPSWSRCQQGNWTKPGVCVLVPDTPHGRDGHADGNSRGRGVDGFQGVGGQGCPDPPKILNGDIVSKDQNSVTYQCISYYKIKNGNARVTCQNGQWDTPPRCEANYCKVVGKVHYLKELPTAKYITEGGRENFECDNYYWITAIGSCHNGRITFSGCGQHYNWEIESAQ